MRRRSAQRFVALLALIVLIASACGGSTTSNTTGSTGVAKSGGFLKIGELGQIDSLNPFVAFNADPYTIFMYEYPVLAQYNTQGCGDTPPSPDCLKFIPDFATSWEHNADQTQWTFHTVPDAKWSDGQPLTADDVAWTFNTIIKYRNGPTSNSAGYITHMTSAKATDPNTVVVNYSAPVVNALAQLEGVPILPEQVWGKYATGDGKGLRQFANTPQNGQPVVSGGPFMLTEYKQDQFTKFEANPNWYGPKPSMTGFGLQYFATDDAAVQSLKTGEVDAIWASVPSTAVDTLRQAGITVSITPGTTFHELIINSNPKEAITHPELQDPAVRQAMSHAINYSEIVNTAWNGYAQPGYSIVPPASGNEMSTGKPWTDPSLKPYTYDLALANKILDDAGYKMGPDGVRIAGDHEMKYTLIFPHAETGSGMRAFQIYQADFKKIGIDVTPQVLNDNAAWQANIKDHYTAYDLIQWDWGAGIDPDFILSVLTCKQWYYWSDSAYCNPAYDKLYAEQAAAADPAKRLQIVYQMQEMIYKDMPYILLNYEDNKVAWDKNWTGFDPSPLGEFSYLSKQSIEDGHLVG